VSHPASPRATGIALLARVADPGGGSAGTCKIGRVMHPVFVDAGCSLLSIHPAGAIA
jgi:hypothetical protein